MLSKLVAVLVVVFAASATRVLAGSADSVLTPHWILSVDHGQAGRKVVAWLSIPGSPDRQPTDLRVQVRGPSELRVALSGVPEGSAPLAGSRPGMLEWRGTILADTLLEYALVPTADVPTRVIASVSRRSGVASSSASVESEFIQPKPAWDLQPVPMAIYSMLVGLFGGVMIQIFQRWSEERGRRRDARETTELMIARELSTELIVNERELRAYVESLSTGTPEQPPTLSMGGINEVFGTPSAVAFLEDDRRGQYMPALRALSDAMDEYNRLSSSPDGRLAVAAEAVLDQMKRLNSTLLTFDKQPMRIQRFLGRA